MRVVKERENVNSTADPGTERNSLPLYYRDVNIKRRFYIVGKLKQTAELYVDIYGCKSTHP